MRRTLRALLFGLILLFLMASTLVSADPVDAYVLHQMRMQHIPGLSLAVVKDGKLVKAKGYGFASLELKAPATPATVYQLASVTKQFTATAIMLLAQDGKLSLEDKIGRYLDGTPDAWKAITLRHLLTHTSGLPDYLDDEAVRAFRNTTPEKIMQAVAGHPLDFMPGARYNYSNTDYVLLASIVHKVSGKTYDAFLTERVFQPLGMTSTFRTSPTDLIPNRAAGYSWQNDTLQNSAYLDPTLWDNGDGGMLSTVPDLVKWDATLNGDAILTAASKQQMWAPVRLNDGTTYNYGFGWSIDEFHGHRRIEHNGNRPGTSVTFSRYVDDKLTVIVLADVDSIDTLEIADRVAGLYAPALSPPVYQSIPDTEPQVTARVKAIMDGFAQGKIGSDLLPSNIWINPWIGLSPFNGWKSLSDVIYNLGAVRSLALVERKDEGEERFYRYRVTYPKERLLLSCRFNKENKPVRIGFQLEWP